MSGAMSRFLAGLFVGVGAGEGGVWAVTLKPASRSMSKVVFTVVYRLVTAELVEVAAAAGVAASRTVGFF